jgi:quinol monooxygenase YgiN
MILVLGSVVVREDSLPEALTLSHEHVARSRSEPGCIAHAVHRDTENPNRLVFVEQWASQELLWAHFRVPASGAFVRSLAALAREAPALAIYEATPVAAPGASSH